ncbi:hypothetical protein B0J14DRAFT_610215 [Halenospora varia]|nr:hypothetical protein B0J14DRAFT_610215 [Halenospora varia]
MASITSPSLLDFPLSPAPEGVTSNFKNPTSRANQVYIAAAICLPLIFLFAGLRIWAKLSLMKGRRTWDDLTCTLGLIAGTFFISITVAAVGGGAYGIHQWDLTIRDFTKTQLILTLIVESVYGPCIWFIKLSLFVLYLEIFGLLKWMRFFAISGMVVTGLFYFSSMVAFLAMCVPTKGHDQFDYLFALAQPRCAKSTMPLVTATGVVNVISDLFLIALPLPAVWKLQLPTQRKWGVSAMFLTGFAACIASILGLVYRISITRHTTDNTWVVIPVWVTTIVEMTAGMLVCCMPTTTAAFKKLKTPLNSVLSRNKGSSMGSSGATGKHSEGSTSELGHDAVWIGPDACPNEWQVDNARNPQMAENGKVVHVTTSIAVAHKPREVF